MSNGWYDKQGGAPWPPANGQAPTLSPKKKAKRAKKAKARRKSKKTARKT